MLKQNLVSVETPPSLSEGALLAAGLQAGCVASPVGAGVQYID